MKAGSSHGDYGQNSWWGNHNGIGSRGWTRLGWTREANKDDEERECGGPGHPTLVVLEGPIGV